MLQKKLNWSPTLAPGMKPCSQCRRILPFDAFYKSERHRNGRKGPCIECSKANARAREAATYRSRRQEIDRLRLPVRRAFYRSQTLRRYGLTLRDYQLMLENQSGGCGICGARSHRLVVDHCHATGRVRGLLCQTCNKGLGALGDTVEAIRGVLSYLTDSA